MNIVNFIIKKTTTTSSVNNILTHPLIQLNDLFNIDTNYQLTSLHLALGIKIFFYSQLRLMSYLTHLKCLDQDVNEVV